jgi:chaperonin cofactor prefoldin
MDLRYQSLDKRITEYENRVKVAECDLRDYKQTLSSLKEELKIHMDNKQGELL